MLLHNPRPTPQGHKVLRRPPRFLRENLFLQSPVPISQSYPEPPQLPPTTEPANPQSTAAAEPPEQRPFVHNGLMFNQALHATQRTAKLTPCTAP